MSDIFLIIIVFLVMIGDICDGHSVVYGNVSSSGAMDGGALDGRAKSYFVAPDASGSLFQESLRRFSTADVESGAVRVIAKAPSGSTYPLQVIEQNGVYTTNFIPSEIGDWQISVVYQGDHVEGSPFSVRVYDPSKVKVTGLKGATIGKPYQFTVDTGDAGEGLLEVVVTHQGSQLPVEIGTDNFGRYHATFIPRSPGLYNIEVIFAGVSVNGSPFSLEIIDLSGATVAGPGVGAVQVNRSTSFTIYTARNDVERQDLNVTITSPSRQLIHPEITDNHDGTFRVDYMPYEIGTHSIEVNYRGQSIVGCPFISQAYDASSITVSNLPALAVVGTTVEFDIDVSRAGAGTLELVINDGLIPCSVVACGDHKYSASFIAGEPAAHVIDITFNGEQVIGSPWTVEVHDTSGVEISGPGISSVTGGRGLVPVGLPTRFDVSTGTTMGSVSVNIRGPSGREVPSKVTNQINGMHNVEYTPMEIGSYSIEVSYNGVPVPGCPFSSKAYSTAAISVGPVPVGFVGTPVEFNIDVTRAGEGQLEIMVNDGTVPNTVRVYNKGVFQLSFVPREAMPHTVDVLFNGEPLLCGSITVTVLDASQVVADGDGLRLAAVDRTSSFNISLLGEIDAESKAESELVIRLYSPSGRELPVNMMTSADVAWQRNEAGKAFKVDYCVHETGTHGLEVKYGGVHITGSPFQVRAFDISKVKIQGITDGVVGQQSTFVVDVTDVGEGDMVISIASMADNDVEGGQNIPNQVSTVPRKAGGAVNFGEGATRTKFAVSYTPRSSGPHRANIVFNNQHVDGSPFEFDVFDLTKIVVNVSGLNSSQSNRMAAFNIQTPDSVELTDLSVKITEPSGKEVRSRVISNDIGLFTVEYLPTCTGEHQLEVKYRGLLVPDSPYVIKVWDPSKVIVSNIQPGKVNKLSTFNIDASHAGSGQLEIIVTATAPSNTVTGGILARGFSQTSSSFVGGTEETVPNFVTSEGGRKFRVTFTPMIPETHYISVKFNGQPVPGHPFVCEMIDSSQNSLQLQATPSEGVIRIPVDRLATVVIDRGQGTLQSASAVCEIIGPSNKIMHAKVSSVQGQNLIKAEFLPREVGTHCIQVTVLGIEVVGSPFVCDVYDPSLITVTILHRGVVSRPCSIEVDTSRIGGGGELEVVVEADRHRQPCKLTDRGAGRWRTQFTPWYRGAHLVHVNYNREPLPASPYRVEIDDVIPVTAYGPSLLSAPVGQLARFTVESNNMAAYSSQPSVTITGPPPECRICSCSVSRGESDFFFGGSGGMGGGGAGSPWNVEWTPLEIGVYTITVQYGGRHVVDGPFKCKAYDLSKVRVLRDDEVVRFGGHRSQDGGVDLDGIPGDDVIFYDASDAGPGNLEVVVRCAKDGSRIPNYLEAEDRSSGVFCVCFTPRADCFNYKVDVSFNGQPVTGTPFFHSLLDSSNAVAGGEGLGGNVLAGRPTNFQVDILRKSRDRGGKGTGTEQLEMNVEEFQLLQVDVVGPNGYKVPVQIVDRLRIGFNVVYTPKLVGRYKITVRYVEAEINGSPFYIECFDPNLVRVGPMQQGVVGKPVSFDVDTSDAGQGQLTVLIKGRNTQPRVSISGDGCQSVSFRSQESGQHLATILYNEEPIPGNPYVISIVDPESVHVDWSSARLCAVDRPVCIDVFTGAGAQARRRTASAGDIDLVATITDPYGRDVPTRVFRPTKVDATTSVEFTPRDVGPHAVTLTCWGEPLPGCPFTCCAFDASRVKLSPDKFATTNIRNEVALTVDTSDAGCTDEIEVEVRSSDGSQLITKRQQISAFCYKFTFVPISIGHYTVAVTLNKQAVAGSPLSLYAIDPIQQMSLDSSNSSSIVVGSQAYSTIRTQGLSVSLADIRVVVTAPNGELVESQLIQQSSCDCKILFSSKYTGRHKVIVTYCDQQVSGSPFHVEIFDPSRVKTVGKQRGNVGEKFSFEVLKNEAGRAELGISIVSPRGSNLPFDAVSTPNGQRITYEPRQSGIHLVYLTYGGLNVSGNPTKHEIVSIVSRVKAFGEGLVQGVKDRMTFFTVETTSGQGHRSGICEDGDLAVRVEGPTSAPKCVIDSVAGSGLYKVSYVPQEVGFFNVYVKYNGQNISGSPFRVRINDPQNVIPVGPWAKSLEVSNRITLNVHQLNELEFDTSLAGPGQPRCEVLCSDGSLPVDVTSHSADRFTVGVVPRIEGEHRVVVYWNEVLISCCPIIGSAMRPGATRSVQSVTQATSPRPATPSPDANKIMLTGMGLHQAAVNQPATFVIDGTEAGPGSPHVRLIGLNNEIDVECTSLGGDKYQCTYLPTIPGAYLMEVMWSNSPVRGSPFKVAIEGSRSNASKVIFFASPRDGQNDDEGMFVGQKLQWEIDARAAGSGELTARCTGPTKMAMCELADHRNGTFTLVVRAQEKGRHQLEILYGSDQIPGSPFLLQISGAPDASKVIVSGPGLADGVLATYNGQFTVNTTGAGPGQLTIRVRGPKGAFRVEMTRSPVNDRQISCRYNPTETGTYVIDVKWTGVDVPGSPFQVHICNTIEELEQI